MESEPVKVELAIPVPESPPSDDAPATAADLSVAAVAETAVAASEASEAAATAEAAAAETIAAVQPVLTDLQLISQRQDLLDQKLSELLALATPAEPTPEETPTEIEVPEETPTPEEMAADLEHDERARKRAAVRSHPVVRFILG